VADENRQRLDRRAGSEQVRVRVSAAVRHRVALTISCLITYELVMHVLTNIHSLSAADDLLGEMSAVIATVFIYRESQRQSREAAAGRAAATLLSLVLCLIYCCSSRFIHWAWRW
jgi:hypothetical protein